MVGRDEFNRALGQRIKNAREAARIRQDQLARAVDLSRTSITNIERGRQGVQAYLLTRIAEVLSCAAADLLPTPTAESSSPLPAKLQKLDPSKREWAERVLGSSHVEEEHET